MAYSLARTSGFLEQTTALSTRGISARHLINAK